MKYLLGLLLLWAVGATVYGTFKDRQGAVYEARAERAEGQNAASLRLANLDSNEAVVAMREADTQRRQAQALRQIVQIVRDSLDHHADSLIPLSPAICAPLANLAEGYRAVVARQELVIVGLTEAARQDSVALSKRGEESRVLRVANDSLAAVLHGRPKVHKWMGLLPKPMLFVGYGMSLSGGVVRTGPVVGVGLQIRW